VTKFTYNTKTCRFEREGFSFWRTLGRLALITFLSIAFFAGIAALHAFFWQDADELKLRTENRALKQHYPVVKNQFDESEKHLHRLTEKDNVLKASLFNSIFVEAKTIEKQSHQYVAFADLRKLRKNIKKLSEHTQTLKEDATFNSYFFADGFSNKRKDIIHKLLKTPSILPVADGKLTSGFGNRIHPFHKGLYQHTGIDITATRGTPVMATADGIVTGLSRSDLLAGYGNLIEISHSQEMLTRYAHLETITVKRGQKIKKGQVIGTVGNSGGSIAPHVHYEVVLDGKEQNPMYYLLDRMDAHTYQQLYAISVKQNQSLD
jgi:murein DD-endopeptidase MepM/ murein hydrolase activator NlpD